MMNNVHSLPMDLPTDLPTKLPTEIYSVGNFVGKNDTSSFFLLCFNFFSHGNSLGISVCIYRFSGNDVAVRIVEGIEQAMKMGKIEGSIIDSRTVMRIESEDDSQLRNLSYFA
jgi:hypothetical protein